MEILFLCHRLPYPPDKGDKIRSHALLTHFAARHTVHVACFVDSPGDWAHTGTVRRLAGGECLFISLKPARKWLHGAIALLSGQTVTTVHFGSRKISRWVRSLMKARRVDRAVVFSSAMAPYILEQSSFDPHNAVLDLVDVDSEKWRQFAETAHWSQKWIFRREAAKLQQLERAAAKTFGATVLVSPYEAASFATLAPESASRIHTISNGVDLNRFARGQFANPFHAQELPIVMTGRMDYWPNVDGALWFAREVMPHFGHTLPRARFYIVGSSPSRALRALADDKVVVTGEVDDVRPYLQHAAVVVAPLRLARGVQNKVLEAMAMERPVVATREAARSLDVTAGVELWIENDPSRFGIAVAEACRQPDCQQIARNGRKYVERCHDWQKNFESLDSLLMESAPVPERHDGRPLGAHAAGSSGRQPEHSKATPQSIALSG